MEDGYLFGYVIISICWGLIWGVVTKKIIENKGYNENWFWWGFFFGFFAMIVALSKPEVPRRSLGEPKGLSYTGLSGNSKHMGAPSSNNSWVCICGARNMSAENICSRCGKNRYSSPKKDISVKSSSLKNTSWVCECGTRNSAAHLVCFKCGKEKREADSPVKTAAKENEAVDPSKNKKDVSIGDTAEQIKSFKKLLDDGIITEEEFAAKKKQILGI